MDDKHREEDINSDCPHDEVSRFGYRDPYPRRDIHRCVRCRAIVLDEGTKLSDEEYDEIYAEFLRGHGSSSPRSRPTDPSTSGGPLGPRPCGLPPWGEP